MWRVLKKWRENLFDLIFPKNCARCQKEGSWLCASCRKALDITPHQSPRPPKSTLTRLLYALDYRDPFVRHLISLYKYHFVRDLSHTLSIFLSRILIPYLPSHPQAQCVLAPIPLHKKRLRWRGFNQAALLALHLHQKLALPYRDDLLIRWRATAPQVHLKRKKRQRNVHNAFLARQDYWVNGKIIILVDDVCTTGATLEEAAKAILNVNKPKEIWGLVVAKG